MTAPTHDSFAEMAAAYALGALDAGDRQSFEAHLASCATCQRELAELGRVTAGLGLAADPVAPPASLKARTIAKATSQAQARAAAVPLPRPVARPQMTVQWLLAAASLAVAIGAGIYAFALRSQIDHMQQTVTELSDRANRMRNERDEARRDAIRLTNVLEVVRGPATLQVSLSGTKDAPNALGRAFFNPSRGTVVSTERLPALRPGRAYQLWFVVPNHPKPLSGGVFSVAANGAAIFVATMPANLSVPAGTPVTLAVTEEPSGGSDGPTSAILLAGQMTGR